MNRHDRTGQLVEHDEQAELIRDHDQRCREGWLGEDKDGRVVPCLDCRPHLADRRRQLELIFRASGDVA